MPMNMSEFYYLVDSQNYTQKEIEIIYGNKEKVNKRTLRTLLDKAFDKYKDYRVFEIVNNKYDSSGNLI